MELDEQSQKAVKHLGDAINSAVEKSPRVSEAIENLREIGFEPHLTLRLEIALQKNEGRDFAPEEIELELTDEDLQTLRRMKIKF